MPHYYFHVFNDETSLDEEGQELPDLEAARACAVASARSLMADELKDGRIVLSHHIAVHDEQDERVFKVTFGDAVEVRP